MADQVHFIIEQDGGSVVIRIERYRRDREPRVRSLRLTTDEAAQLAALLTAHLPPVTVRPARA